MSSLFTDLKHRNMKDIKRKLEQLTYEINLVKSDEPDKMTGVMIRLEELTDLVNKLLIPDVRRSIFEFFTPDEIGLFQHLVKQYSKSEKWDDYKQNKLDKLEGKLKQLRSF